MSNSGRIKSLVIAALLVLFAFGMWQLMQLRFQAGDIYPEYSSLRADPRGSKALYESLDRIPRTDLRRHYFPPNRLTGNTNSTLFFLGTPNMSLITESAEALEKLANDGARVVITFSADMNDFGHGNSAAPPPKLKPGEKRKETPVLASIYTGKDTNGFSADGKTLADLATAEAKESLPATLVWLSPRFFKGETNGCSVLYANGTNSVMVERTVGQGSIVLATDSYFLSNEALRNDREPELIAYLLGDNRTLVFSEWQLGIEHGSGIAVLARQYRLHGFAFGLMLLVAFYIWKNAVPFVPVYETEEQQGANEVTTSKSAREAFLGLLQKNIPADQVLETCFQEWRKIHLVAKRNLPEKRKEMELVILRQNDLPKKEKNPVAAYKELAGILEREEP